MQEHFRAFMQVRERAPAYAHTSHHPKRNIVCQLSFGRRTCASEVLLQLCGYGDNTADASVGDASILPVISTVSSTSCQTDPQRLSRPTITSSCMQKAQNTEEKIANNAHTSLRTAFEATRNNMFVPRTG